MRVNSQPYCSVKISSLPMMFYLHLLALSFWHYSPKFIVSLLVFVVWFFLFAFFFEQTFVAISHQTFICAFVSAGKRGWVSAHEGDVFAVYVRVNVWVCGVCLYQCEYRRWCVRVCNYTRRAYEYVRARRVCLSFTVSACIVHVCECVIKACVNVCTLLFCWIPCQRLYASHSGRYGGQKLSKRITLRTVTNHN